MPVVNNQSPLLGEFKYNDTKYGSLIQLGEYPGQYMIFTTGSIDLVSSVFWMSISHNQKPVAGLSNIAYKAAALTASKLVEGTSGAYCWSGNFKELNALVGNGLDEFSGIIQITSSTLTLSNPPVVIEPEQVIMSKSKRKLMETIARVKVDTVESLPK